MEKKGTSKNALKNKLSKTDNPYSQVTKRVQNMQIKSKIKKEENVDLEDPKQEEESSEEQLLIDSSFDSNESELSGNSTEVDEISQLKCKSVNNSSFCRLPKEGCMKLNSLEKIKDRKEIMNSINKLVDQFYRSSTIFFSLHTLGTHLTFSDIFEYLVYLSHRYSDFIKVEIMGYSHEKKAIPIVKINWNADSNLFADYVQTANRTNKKTNRKRSRNIICIESGTNGSEWMTINVALYFIYQLSKNFMKHLAVLQKFEFHIIPVVNPDGYEYSRSVNAKWTRNRRPQTGNRFVGVDCNQNFNFDWNPITKNPMKHKIQGEHPFSEPESCILAKYLHENSHKILWYLGLHWNTQRIMYPWTHQKTPPEDAPLLKALALTGQNAIQKFNGRKYHVGSIAEIAKSKTGGSIADYVYGILKVPLVLVMELPRDKLKLNPSPNFINCVCKEAWAGMQQMCNSVIIYKAKYQKKWKDTHIASKGTGFKNWSTDIDYINLICAENSTDAKSTL